MYLFKRNHLENINEAIKLLNKKYWNNEKIPEEDLDQERAPKNPNGDFFIPNLLDFLIPIVLRGGMTHFNVSPTAPSYIMPIWTYISKHVGDCICILGLY